MAAILLQRVSRTQAACPTTLGLAPAGMLALVIVAHYFKDIGEWMLVLVCILGTGVSLLCAVLLSRAVPAKMQGIRWLVGGLSLSGIIGIVSYIIILQWEENMVVRCMSCARSCSYGDGHHDARHLVLRRLDRICNRSLFWSTGSSHRHADRGDDGRGTRLCITYNILLDCTFR